MSSAIILFEKDVEECWRSVFIPEQLASGATEQDSAYGFVVQPLNNTDWGGIVLYSYYLTFPHNSLEYIFEVNEDMKETLLKKEVILSTYSI